jgi:DNA-binding GntR family transcriptional regulator
VLRLCEVGDAKGAVTFLRRHIRQAGENLLRVLREYRAREAA